MKGTMIMSRVMGALVALSFSLASGIISAQSTKPIVYEFGKTMIDLMLQQKAYEGASPAEIEGMKQGIEQQIAVSPISVTFIDEKTMIFEANGESHTLEYRKDGLKVMAKNVQTGEYEDFGFLSVDASTLTIMQRYILDRIK